MIEFDFPGLPANEDKILVISIDPDTKEKKVLGCGTFGAVFLGELTITGKPTVSVAVKVHHPCYEQRQALIDEYKFLKLLGGKFNVIELLTYIYDSERKILHFVYPFFEETPFLSLVVDATEDEVKSYMLNILTALAWLHSSNIMHKDVKYNNFLYNRIMKTGKLIDLGCACYMNELIEGCTRDPNSSGDYVSGPSLFYSTVVVQSFSIIEKRRWHQLVLASNFPIRDLTVPVDLNHSKP
jgi:serine/threonine protein kinase